MRGHIAKKGNRYYAVIYEGIDPAIGNGIRPKGSQITLRP
jgi:hypothetical protein